MLRSLIGSGEQLLWGVVLLVTPVQFLLLPWMFCLSLRCVSRFEKTCYEQRLRCIYGGAAKRLHVFPALSAPVAWGL